MDVLITIWVMLILLTVITFIIVLKYPNTKVGKWLCQFDNNEGSQSNE
jgi:type IV secretory pathway component VirB8